MSSKKTPSNSGQPLSAAAKIGYGTGQAAQRIQMGSLNQMANPIFNDVLGVDPRLIGLALGLARIVDALTDPLIGHLSDHTRSRFGRRRPWIALAAPLCGLAYAGMWMFPTGQTPSFYLGWFFIATLIYYFCLSLFSVPYVALGMELTPDYHERTSVMAYRTTMATMGGLLVSSLFWLINLNTFSNMAQGMRHIGLILGVLIALFTLVPALFSREHPDLLRHQSRQTDRPPLMESARQTLTHKPFLMLMGTTILISTGMHLVQSMNYYVTVYHVFEGHKTPATGLILSLAGYASLIGVLCGLPLWTRLSRKWGKKQALLIALFAALAACLLRWICYTPANPYLTIIPSFFHAFCMSSIWMLLQAMLPDVVDLDELKTSARRGGMFSAIHSWTTKMGHSVSLIASGFVLSATGFNALNPDGQSSRTILALRLCYTFIPALGLLCAALLISRYPLSDHKIAQLRNQLNHRRNPGNA